MSAGRDHEATALLQPWQQWLALQQEMVALVTGENPDLNAIAAHGVRVEAARQGLPSLPGLADASTPPSAELSELLHQGQQLNEQILSGLARIRHQVQQEQAVQSANEQRLRRTLDAYNGQQQTATDPRFIDRHR